MSLFISERSFAELHNVFDARVLKAGKLLRSLLHFFFTNKPSAFMSHTQPLLCRLSCLDALHAEGKLVLKYKLEPGETV
jgi:hypothetical protein